MAVMPIQNGGLDGLNQTRIATEQVTWTNQFFRALAVVDERITKLTERLEEIAQLIGRDERDQAKEYYTVCELGKLVGRVPYTVRKWCYEGRIIGKKAAFGRGNSQEWRISHQELVRYRSEGLLSRKPHSRIPPPERLG